MSSFFSSSSSILSDAFNFVLNHAFFTVLFLLTIIPLAYLTINEIVRYGCRIGGFIGPPNRFLVGNLPDIAVNAPEVFRLWAAKYGDVFQIQLGNTPILVVNSAAAAKELLGHHSHALSSRPTFYTFHKVTFFYL
jgi:3-hydroxyphenylacetate 6-hydroxylase